MGLDAERRLGPSSRSQDDVGGDFKANRVYAPHRFADHSLGRLGGPGSIVWDAYFAFGANARWRSEPSGLLAAGSDIIDNTSRLQRRIVPLLTAH
jgi:hypothetical protein